MALTKCKECKKEVSTSAKLCPHCGVKNPDPNGFIKLILGFAGISLVVWYITSGDSKKKNENAAEPATTHTKVIYEKDYGDKWAFTFDRGVLICDKQALWIENPRDERIYPLNGLAIGRAKWKLDSTWKESPEKDGTKISLTPFINEAQKLCE